MGGRVILEVPKYADPQAVDRDLLLVQEAGRTQGAWMERRKVCLKGRNKISSLGQNAEPFTLYRPKQVLLVPVRADYRGRS